MSIKWKKAEDFSIQILLDKINNLKTLNEDESISFNNSFEFHNCEASLYTLINFPKKTSFYLNKGLLWKSIVDISKIENLTEKNLIDKLNDNFQIENSKKEKTYFLLTSISLNGTLPIESIKIKDSDITLYSCSFPSKFSNREDFFNKKVKNIYSEFEYLPKSYTPVVVKIKANNEHIASELALDNLELFRASLSIMANSLMEITSEEHKPINKIRLGNFHTLHEEEGNVIESGIYWYEPSFKYIKPYSFNGDIDVFKSNIIWIFKQLKNCNYSNILENSMVRYVKALDDSDQHVAMIHLWGVLESLVGNNGNLKNKVADRCSFLYREREFHRTILKHLQIYRNEHIHEGKRNEAARTYTFQLQNYFIRLLTFHLHYSTHFESLNEVNKFLDLPSDINKLDKEIELIKKAKSFTLGEDLHKESVHE